MKSPIKLMKNKEPRYRATFNRMSKNMTFFAKCKIIVTITSLIDVGAAVGFVPLASFLNVSEVGVLKLKLGFDLFLLLMLFEWPSDDFRFFADMIIITIVPESLLIEQFFRYENFW